jgi:hypothetical protein
LDKNAQARKRIMLPVIMALNEGNDFLKEILGETS